MRDRRGLTVLVRNALFARVRLAAADNAAELGRMDIEWGFGERRWKEALDAYYAEHDEILTDADARSSAYLVIDESPEASDHAWRVRQIFSDEAGDHDFGIAAWVDLDATQETGEAVFTHYRVGFAEDLREEEDESAEGAGEAGRTAEADDTAEPQTGTEEARGEGGEE